MGEGPLRKARIEAKQAWPTMLPWDLKTSPRPFQAALLRAFMPQCDRLRSMGVCGFEPRALENLRKK
jgi:hypothetical protein